MKIYLKKRFKADRAIMGFMGIGGVGYFTIKHMVENLDGVEKIAIVDWPYIQPVASYTLKGLGYPVELYLRDGNVFLKAEDLPRGYKTNLFIRGIIRYLARKGVREVIAIGGLTKNLQEDENDKIRIIRNRFWSGDIGYREAPNNLRIFGPLATALMYTELLKIPSIAILSFADTNMIDPIAISNAVEALNSILCYNVSTRELVDVAVELSKIMHEMERIGEGDNKNIYT